MVAKSMKLVIALFLAVLSSAVGHNHTIVTPKAFRIGAVENIVLNLHGYEQATVSAHLQDIQDQLNIFSVFPDTKFSSPSTNQPIVIPCQVNNDNMRTFQTPQRVLLVVQVTQSAANFAERIEMLVSRESGYLFVRTSRPVYKPGERVLIQVVPLNQTMAPEKDTIVTVTVKTPDGVRVFKRSLRLPNDNFIELQYDISEFPALGVWFIEAAYTSNGYERRAESQFRVDRYVTPTFNVKIEMNEPFLLPSSIGIFGKITAHTRYGAPVYGGEFILRINLKRSPDSLPTKVFEIPTDFFRTARFLDGEALIEIPIQEVIDQSNAEESIQTLIESNGSIFLETVIYDYGSGNAEAARSPDIPFLSFRHLIDISRTSLYYTPGLAYSLRVVIRHVHTEEPVGKIPVVLTIREDGAMPYSVNTSSNPQGEVIYRIDFVGEGNKVIDIAINSEDDSNENQAHRTITIRPYISASNSYLQIEGYSSETAGLLSGNYFLRFIHNANRPPSEIRYFIVARGSVVLSGTHLVLNQRRIGLEVIPVTQDMVPRSRVVAYYISGSEIVSNSFWFDVTNQCKTDLTVAVPDQQSSGSNVSFQIQGEPHALVAVSVVDREAYLTFNKTRLVRDSMFDAMASHEQGCMRNGGNDTRNVYLNAGLVISSEDLLPTLIESLDDCDRLHEVVHQKRSTVEDAEGKRTNRQTDTKHSRRKEEFLRQCDRDGRFIFPIFQSCDARSRRVQDRFEGIYPECSVAFQIACNNATAERFLMRLQLAQLRGRGPISGKIDLPPLSFDVIETSLSQSRAQFQENLLFASTTLNHNGVTTISTHASADITPSTFEVDAISMASISNGFCISNTENLLISKDIYLEVSLPFSIKVRERGELRISLFNSNPKNGYSDLTIKAEIPNALCTNYTNEASTSNTQILVSKISIRRHSTRQLVFPIFPNLIPAGGTASITVLVTQSHSHSYDEQVLDQSTGKTEIQEVGELREIYQTVAIDVKEGETQNINFVFAFPENFVPGSRQCFIHAYSNFLGPSLDVNPVTGEPRRVEEIFRAPYGGGEQTMMVCGPNIYIHMYLETIGTLTPAVQPRYGASIKRMEDCYARALSWRSVHTHPERIAFSVWVQSPPSLWLNAYVIKVFARAKDYYVDLDIGPLCTALNWMVGEQTSRGFFNESYHTFHREMKGVEGRRTLAAYALISLEESKHLCPDLEDEIDMAITKVVDYLVAEKDHSAFQGRPYSLALLSYAFALHNSSGNHTKMVNDRLIALHRISPDNKEIFWRGRRNSTIEGTDVNPYWYTRPQAVDIEATAYALLAQVQIAKTSGANQTSLEFLRKIARWLVGQRNEAGAFISTQDTVIGLQALATYQIYISSLNPTQQSTDVTVSLSGSFSSAWEQGSGYRLLLNESNDQFSEIVQVPDSVLNGIFVNASVSGRGEGVLSYRCTYRTLVNEEGCHFKINQFLTIKRDNFDDPEATIIYTLEVSIEKTAGSEAELSVVEIGMLTGLTPDKNSIIAISSSHRVDGIVERFDINDDGVVLYFNNIDADGVRFAIDLVQTAITVSPQPAEIKVFDYYEPSVQCSTFYNLDETLHQPLECSSFDSQICNCAEGGCPKCRTRDDYFSNTLCLDQRTNCPICENDNCRSPFAEVCESNYAYFVNVLSVTRESNVFVRFTGFVNEVLKQGVEANITNNSTETFLMRTDCFSKCVDNRLDSSEDYIRPGRELLIMGERIDVSLDRSGNKQRIHELDDHGIIERRIPFSTCQRRRKFVSGNCRGEIAAFNRERCRRQSQFVTACENYELLRDRLIRESCD